MIEGTVQQFNLDSFIILKDETGVIYVDTYLSIDHEISIGDNLVVYGYRGFYNYSNGTPVLVSYGVVKNKGAGNPIENEAEVIDVAGIYDIDHNEPNQHLKYVTFTGKIIFTGNSYYPSHAILENEDMIDFKLE